MSSNIYDSTQRKLIPFAGNSAATAGALDDLEDVSISSPSDGEVLKYDATNDMWVNGTGGGATIDELGDIEDVDLDNLADGQVIVWDATNSKWVNADVASPLTAGFGIDISNDEINTTDFVGTQAEWNALTSTQKAAYDFIHITDDTNVVNEGAPGHAISDETSEKTQRTGLKFEGFTVTDDSTNDLTKIADIPYTAGDGIEIDANKEVTTDPDLLPFTFVGDTATWNGLTTDEKAQYKLVNLTDDVAGGDMVVEDAVTEDSVNPVTSGAVYSKTTPTEITLTNVNSMVQGSVKAYVVNDIVTVEFFAYDTVTLSAGTWVAMVTVPEGYRIPSDYASGNWKNFSAPVIVGRGGQMGELRVHDTGVISVYAGTATSNNALVGSVSYRLHSL